MAPAPISPALNPVAQGHPQSHGGHSHPLQGDDKGLVPGPLGHWPPARLTHDAIVHLQHSQYLTWRARAGAQGRPGVRVLAAPQLPTSPYSLASSLPPRCCLALPRSHPWEGLPASVATGERPGTAVSSCSQPRRRTCSVPVGSVGVWGTSSGVTLPLPLPVGAWSPRNSGFSWRWLNPDAAHVRPRRPSATLQADRLRQTPLSEDPPCVGDSRDTQAEEQDSDLSRAARSHSS